jgi:hypothetical protein
MEGMVRGPEMLEEMSEGCERVSEGLRMGGMFDGEVEGVSVARPDVSGSVEDDGEDECRGSRLLELKSMTSKSTLTHVTPRHRRAQDLSRR